LHDLSVEALLVMILKLSLAKVVIRITSFYFPLPFDSSSANDFKVEILIIGCANCVTLFDFIALK
jgi:hypothetical protein